MLTHKKNHEQGGCLRGLGHIPHVNRIKDALVEMMDDCLWKKVLCYGTEGITQDYGPRVA